jgi:hypothetical protein
MVQVFCDHCHDDTEQKIIKVETNTSKDTRLLTTYRCKVCGNENYGDAERSKFDTTVYPVKPLISPEQLENSIKDNNNWKPRRLEFKIEDGQYFIGEIYDEEFEFSDISKEEYYEERFQHKFQLKLYEAIHSSTITSWEYPPVNYKINEDCDIIGHDMDYYLEYEDQYGLETFTEFLDKPDMVFVGSKRGECNRCQWHSITVFPKYLRQWYFQKKRS